MMAWLYLMFREWTAKNGGVVYRSKSSVNKYASFGKLKAEVKRRGYHLIETKDHYLVICNQTDFKIHC